MNLVSTAPRMPRRLFSILFASVLAASAVAAPLVEYRFDSGSSAPTPSGGIASSFGQVGTAQTYTEYSDGAARMGSNWSATTEAAALTSGRAFTFTLTPEAGSPVSLSTLSFDAAFYSSDPVAVSPNTYTAYFFVEVSIGGGAFSRVGNTLASGFQNTTTGRSGVTFSQWSANLADVQYGSTYQNLTQSIVFRLYAYDQQADGITGISSPTRFLALDNVALSAAAIPEPLSALPIGLLAGGIALVYVRRRRQNRCNQ